MLTPASVPPVVFIIDHDLAVLSALAFAFEAEGFRTCAFRTTARADVSPGLVNAACIVLDQDLPDESGLDYLVRLRLEGRARPAILIPSDPALYLRLEAMDMGVPIVEKPLLDDALFQAVKALVRPPKVLAKL